MPEANRSTLDRAETAPNRIIEAHLDIWSKHHEPLGIDLAESKSDWLELLNGDPHMQFRLNWGDLAGTLSDQEVAEFRAWLEADRLGEGDA